MSQLGVVSRPGTQQSLSARLPEIQHPLSRLGNPDTLDIRGGGVSRAGYDRPATQQSLTGRPLTQEGPLSAGRRTHTSSGRGSRVSARPAQPPPLTYEAIPEGIETAQGDPAKTRLPVFGSRAGIASRDGECESRVMSRLSQASAQARLEIDELEAVIKEKIKSSYYELKNKFKANDPEQKGNVTKDGLFRILLTVLNRPMNQNQFSRLLERIGLGDKQVTNFTEFFACFRDIESSEYPRWMDTVQRQWQDKATMSAAQVHLHFKEKAKQRVKDIADLIPQSNPDGSGRILKPEFRNVLCQMGFFMDDDEFEKLWSKYDIDGTGTINGEKLMAKLGINIQEQQINGRTSQVSSSAGRPLRKKEADRQRSLTIENWLKIKFRQGFKTMKASFEKLDTDKSGTIAHDQFLNVLSEHGLKLEKPNLAEFLARCSVQPTRTHVPYREFLHRFLDRSEDGMAHNVLTNPKHRYNRAQSPGAVSTMSALETQLINMFQRDFLALLGKFNKIDKLGLDVISQEEFRAAVESHFSLDMTDEQFSSFVDRVPLDPEGNVKYADFMAQFDTKGKARSLFTEIPEPKRGPTPPASPPSSPQLPPPEQEEEVEEEVVEREPEPLFDVHPRRSPQDLFKLIKNLLKNRYQDVEMGFHELDETNTGRLSQEMMFHLLKKFDVSPEITRGEIRDLWKTFITNQDKTLNFHQFTRHFGYSLRSAAFPNAKISPPKRGDADFMIRSRKLNCAADMLQDSLRSKIDYMWEDLRREFVAMDPYGTGFVSTDEFCDVLTELCVHLSDYEQNLLVKKFQTPDGRVSYMELLKPFAMRRQTWRHGNNMLSLLQHSQAELPIHEIVDPPQKGLVGITSKLRQKVANDWRNLRRMFKKMDKNNEGYLTLPEFRSVLKLANVILDEEEVYQVMSKFDEDMSGKIPYQKFLNETFKPGRASSLSKSVDF